MLLQLFVVASCRRPPEKTESAVQGEGVVFDALVNNSVTQCFGLDKVRLIANNSTIMNAARNILNKPIYAPGGALAANAAIKADPKVVVTFKELLTKAADEVAKSAPKTSRGILLKPQNIAEFPTIFRRIAAGIGAKVRWNVLQVDLDYAGEQFGAVFGKAVKYLSDVEREAYRVVVRNGKLFYQESGKAVNTTAKGSKFGHKAAIYVMDEFGNFFISENPIKHVFHHSSLMAGRPAAAAGEMYVENGVLKFINNQSGHYRPGPTYLEHALKQLRDNGLDVGKVRVEVLR